MKEENEHNLNFWKHVSKSIDSFNHDVFINNNKESLSAVKSLSINSYVLKPFKKTASQISPKTPSVCRPSQNYAYYKYQSLKTHFDYNYSNDLKLRNVSVDLSFSHCNFGCNGKDSSRLCENGTCAKYYINQTCFNKFKLRPLSVVLCDFKINKTGFDSKVSSNEITLEKHEIYPGFKSSGRFHNSVQKEDLFTKNEQNPYLPELQLFANKTPVNNAIIQLHRIDETIAFCRNLNLQPVWKNSKLFKSPIKLRKISKLRKTKSVHQS